MKSTREMRDTNKALEDRLSKSKSEINTLQQSLEAIRAESLTDPLTASATANISTALSAQRYNSRGRTENRCRC